MPLLATSLPQLRDKHFTLNADELTRLVDDARVRTLGLVSDLADAELEVPLREVLNPFRWELGHVAFFYEAFVLRPLGFTAPLMAGGGDLYNEVGQRRGYLAVEVVGAA